MSIDKNTETLLSYKKWSLWIFGILVLILLIYIPLHQNGFLVTWDDNRYIIDNPHIKSLDINSMIESFSIYYDGHYHPLTLISLAIDYNFYGLNPIGFHFTNLLLHLINTFLVFWLVFQLLEKKERVIPLVTALLFGISTINVESVAWASERKNLLFASFYLLSLIFYLRYIKTDKTWMYFIALALFVCSLLSKVMTIPLSITLFLIDYFLHRKILSKKVLLEKIPFLLVAVVFGIVAIFAQKSSWGENLGQVQYSFFERVLFSGFAFVGYLFKILIPYKLSGFYPYPDPKNGWIILMNVFFVLLSIGMVVIAFYFRKRNKLVTFGFLFFTTNIFLLLKTFDVPAGDYIMADRYAYISSIGIFLLVASRFNYLVSKSLLYKRMGIFLLVLYALFLSLQTFNRSAVWKDDITFYSDIISKYPNAELAYTNRGAIRKENHQYSKALADFNKAIQLGKNDFKAFANRGAVYSDLGQFDNALADYNKAITLNPNNAELLSNLGFAQLQTGDYKSAINTLNQCLTIQDFNPEAYTNRGTAKFNLGDFQGAIADYKKASIQEPTYVNAHFNRGLANINTGDFKSAIDDFNKAIQINSNHFESYSNLGIAWSKLGDFQKAFQSYDKAIQLNPNYYEAWMNRGVEKYYLNDFEGSLIDLNKVIELSPNLAPAYYFRGLVLLNSDKSTACNDFYRAANLGFNRAISQINKNCK